MARRTGEGSRDPEEHAAPAEAQTPFSLSVRSRASASRAGKPMFEVFQMRLAPAPFMPTFTRYWRRGAT